MDNKEKRIWQYLDGELTPKHRLEVKQKVSADPNYKAAFETAHKLHSGLRQTALAVAPDEMMQHIMSSVQNEKIYVAKQTSFSGLKYVLGGFAGLNALLFAYLVTSGNLSLSASGSSVDYLSKLAAPLEGFQLPATELPSSFIAYGLALGLMVVLFWADQLGNKMKPSRRKV